MQATLHAEDVSQRPWSILVRYFMETDERVCLRAQGGRVLKIEWTKLQLGLLPFAIVPLFAGYLASTASNTVRGVD
jgi:hypothetical protein